jgi:hypothetical protein
VDPEEEEAEILQILKRYTKMIANFESHLKNLWRQDLLAEIKLIPRRRRSFKMKF